MEAKEKQAMRSEAVDEVRKASAPLAKRPNPLTVTLGGKVSSYGGDVQYVCVGKNQKVRCFSQKSTLKSLSKSFHRKVLGSKFCNVFV